MTTCRIRIRKNTKGTIPMGMAASQARFLGLTARLNNVEFEAQQIHQQRTALSNKSGSYYTDLLGIAVPTAPSVEEFTQTIYTFDDGQITNQITAMVAQGNGRYKVSYLKQWEDEFAIVSAAPRRISRRTDSADHTGYYIGTDLLRGLDTWKLDYNDGEANYIDFGQGTLAGGQTVDTVLQGGKFGYMSGGTFVEYTAQDTYNLDNVQRYGIFAEGYYGNLSLDQIIELSGMEAEYSALVQQELGVNSGILVRYVENTTTGEFEPIFYRVDELENADYEDDNGISISNINAYKMGKKTRTEEVIGVENCQMEQDSTGRYMNIVIPTGDPNDPVYIKYALTTNTITDQDAYDDAINQYEYDKAVYDHSIAEINAKIEIIQSEDKNLELRLKQLDTEHNAIQTERDQVKELIKKNVDSSFKTFG